MHGIKLEQHTFTPDFPAIAEASISSPQGCHNLTPDVGIEIPNNIAHVSHSVVDPFEVISLREVVAVAAALAAGENLLE